MTNDRGPEAPNSKGNGGRAQKNRTGKPMRSKKILATCYSPAPK